MWVRGKIYPEIHIWTGLLHHNLSILQNQEIQRKLSSLEGRTDSWSRHNTTHITPCRLNEQISLIYVKPNKSTESKDNLSYQDCEKGIKDIIGYTGKLQLAIEDFLEFQNASAVKVIDRSVDDILQLYQIDEDNMPTKNTVKTIKDKLRASTLLVNKIIKSKSVKKSK